MKNPQEYSTAEFISAYGIYRNGEKIVARIVPKEQKKREDLLKEMVARKPQIMAHLLAEEKAAEKAAREWEEKVDAIPGLMKIDAAMEDLRSYQIEWEENWQRGDSGVGLRPRPQHDIAAMLLEYPRAAAYIKARDMSCAANYAKAAAGKKALIRIVNGEDYEKALSDAEKEWNEHVMEHVWD